MNNLKILNQNGQLVVTTREVSENFEKEHAKVNRSVENLIQGIAKNGDTYNHLFIESEYQDEQNKQTYKEYLLTRDGFSLLVMGFTGAKALEWKLKYIQAFNEMEQTLKTPKTMTQAEILAGLAQVNVELERKVNKLDTKITNALDVFTAPAKDDWRHEMNEKINQMCINQGLNYQGFRHEIYTELEGTARVDLTSRQQRLKTRMKKGGSTTAECKAISKLDIVERDPKLKPIFEGIVRKYKAKYAVI